MAKIPANFNSMAFIKKMKAQKAAAEEKPGGPDLKNYKKPAGPAVDKQFPACMEGRHQFKGKNYCARCGEPAPKALDRRPRLHDALDEAYELVRSGGSIGESNHKVVSSHATREEAAAKAKRYNAMLSPGEKKYYKLKYSVRTAKDRARLHDAIDKMMDDPQHKYADPPKQRKWLSILKPEDLKRMTALGGSKLGTPGHAVDSASE